MKKFGKIVTLALCLSASCAAFASCGVEPDNGGATYITTAIARPTTSGTRGAFDELVKNSEGKTLKSVTTFADCVLEAGETGNVIVNVSNNEKAIGYISLGSVAGNESIKAVKVEGVDATVENIKSADYKLARPFNLVYKTGTELNELAKDFLKFVESAEGQAIINGEYIGQKENAASYAANSYTGSITSLTLWGSTSVTPLMNQLVTKYQELNSSKTFTFTVGGGGSGEGVTEALKDNGTIGMISRALKTSGDETGLTAYKLADDGIAMIVNVKCTLTDITMDEIYNLYANGTKVVCD